MKKINKKRSSSFCMCFHLVDMENGLVPEPEKRSEEVKPVLEPAVNMSQDDKDKGMAGSFGRKNKLGRRSFSRYVKAVFFETAGTMKMRNKKLEQKLHRTFNNVKSNSKKLFDSKSINDILLVNHKSCDEDNPSTTTSSTYSSCLRTNSATTNSSPPSSTTASRCSSSSLSLSERPENSMQGKGNGKGFFYGYNAGMCSFLVSLFVLIVCGKLCAIFCTSTWLFFTIRWSVKLSPSGNSVNHFPEIDIEKYNKKKVIMEGLLERKHSRNR